jgi:hypothetical protein
MSNPSILACDVGYGNTKWYATLPGDNKRTDGSHFPSRAIVSPRPFEVANYGRKIQVHALELDGKYIYVGKDVELLVKGTSFAALERDYPLTEHYHALLLGAMAESRLTDINLLLLGLPGRIYRDEAMRAAMKEKYVGIHTVAGRHVRVGHVHVIARRPR